MPPGFFWVVPFQYTSPISEFRIVPQLHIISILFSCQRAIFAYASKSSREHLMHTSAMSHVCRRWIVRSEITAPSDSTTFPLMSVTQRATTIPGVNSITLVVFFTIVTPFAIVLSTKKSRQPPAFYNYQLENSRRLGNHRQLSLDP